MNFVYKTNNKTLSGVRWLKFKLKLWNWNQKKFFFWTIMTFIEWHHQNKNIWKQKIVFVYCITVHYDLTKLGLLHKTFWVDFTQGSSDWTIQLNASKVGYRWESWIQIKVNLYTDDKVGNRWEGWIQMRRLDTDEKVGYRWEGWKQMRRLQNRCKVNLFTDA